MTNTEYYQEQAEAMARKDFNSGLVADPSRHGARENSAWAIHYLKVFQILENETVKL